MCGIGGIYCSDPDEMFRIIGIAIDFLKRRGPDSFGVVSVDPSLRQFSQFTYLGKTNGFSDLEAKIKKYEVFKSIQHDLAKGERKIVLLQTRYSTDSRTCLESLADQHEIQEANTQPLLITHRGERGVFDIGAACHNGNIPAESKMWMIGRINPLSAHLADVDSRYLTELFMQVSREKKGDMVGAARWMVDNILGSFSFIYTDGSSIIGFKDRWENRPLCLGEDPWNGSKILVSETGVLSNLQTFKLIQELRSGEIGIINHDGTHKIVKTIGSHAPRRACVFEPVYLQGFNSIFLGEWPNDETRHKLGWATAEFYKDTIRTLDLLVSLPSSGDAYFRGMIQAATLTNPDIKGYQTDWKIENRRFYLDARDSKNRGKNTGGHKFGMQAALYQDKIVGKVDDSIKRGDTTAINYIFSMLAGVKEVHYFIPWPPTPFCCDKGDDTPTDHELIANGLVRKGIITLKDGRYSYDSIERVNLGVSEMLQDKAREMVEEGYSINGTLIKDMMPEMRFDKLHIHYLPLDILKSVFPVDGCYKCVDGVEPPGWNASPAPNGETCALGLPSKKG